MVQEFRTVTVVIGGSVEIGRACCLRAAGPDSFVLFADEDADVVKSVTSEVDDRGGSSAGAVMALDDLDALRTLPSRLPDSIHRVDTLINCQITLEQCRPSTIDVELWEKIIRTNLTGALVLSQTFVPMLAESTQGSIVNVGSIDGILGNPWMPAYSASKAGLLILTQLLAADLGPQGIRANYVARCGTRELMSLMAAESGDDASPNWEERIEAFTPLRRVGTADEVAGVVEFLSSAAASYVNGAVLKVDGGRSSVTQGTL